MPEYDSLLRAPDAIASSARERLTTAAGLASAVLAPAFLCAAESHVFGARFEVDPWEMDSRSLGRWAWYALVALLLGRWPMARATKSCDDWSKRLRRWSVLAGLAYVPVVYAPVFGAASLTQPDWMDRVGSFVLCTWIFAAAASIFAVPLGAAFGQLFSLGARRARPAIAAGSLDGEQHASSAAALVLGLAASIALALVLLIEMPIRSILANSYNVRTIVPPSTLRCALLVGLPALAACLFAADAWRRKRYMDSFVRLLERDAEPAWTLISVDRASEATPFLRIQDRNARRHRLIVRRETHHYRSSASPLAYVGHQGASDPAEHGALLPEYGNARSRGAGE